MIRCLNSGQLVGSDWTEVGVGIISQYWYRGASVLAGIVDRVDGAAASKLVAPDLDCPLPRPRAIIASYALEFHFRIPEGLDFVT